MPKQFTDKNGGLMAGHSERWAEKNRSKNSMNAGSGSRASRNQGLGAQGKANTVAGEVTDTSKMDPAEKLKYFRSLGLLGPEPTPEPEVKEPEIVQEPLPQDQPRFNIKDLVSSLQDTFKDSPKYITAITNELKGMDKQMLLYTAEKALEALNRIKTKTNDPSKIAPYLVREIQKAKD